MQTYDFSQCSRVLTKAYNGANGKKITAVYQNEIWILKFPSDVHDCPNEQSYSNSCFSEHIGSTIYRLLGIDAQQTMLGTHTNGKTKEVCACKDFTRPGLLNKKGAEWFTAIIKERLKEK